MRLSDDTKWVIKQHAPFFPAYAGIVILMLLESAIDTAQPLGMKWLLDVGLPRRSHLGVLLVTGFFLVSYLCRTVFSRTRGFATWSVEEKIKFRIRMRLLKHLHELSASYHDKIVVGDLTERFGEVDDISGAGEEIVLNMLKMIVVCGSSLAVMFTFNHELPCIVFFVVPLLLLAKRVYGKRLQQVYQHLKTINGKVSSFLQEHLAMIVQLQLLRRERTHSRKYASFASGLIRTNRDRRIKEMLYTIASTAPLQIGMIALFGAGGWLVVGGILTIGGLVASYGYMTRLFDPLTDVADINVTLQRTRASIRRVREVLDLPPAVKESSAAVILPRDTEASIAFKNVEFRYSENGGQVLKGISFCVRPGERLAIVGRSGSGKSTIGKLAARLYDVQSGAIYFGGHDVRDLRLRSVRSAIIFLPQEPIMFKGTIRENLLYGWSGATTEDLLEVATIAQIDKKILSLPSQWEEHVGNWGRFFSGGERQRLALARTLLQRPRFLILDECTSAVDAQTESAILKGISDFANVTTIIISHRQSSIDWADRTIVLNDGRCEEATHSRSSLSESGLFVNR